MSNFFSPGQRGPVAYAKRQLWLSHKVSVGPGDRLHFTFESFRQNPRQGLEVDCANRRHRLGVAGQEFRGFTLWTDTAPREVDVTFLAKRACGEVFLTNVWELPGYEQVRFSGVNAAAMSVTEIQPDEWLLECNDGYGLEEPTFQDLVVRVRLERAGTRAPPI